MTMQKTYWGGILLVFLLSLFPLFMRLDSIPLFVFDEGRQANSALEMVQNNNWLVVYYDGKPDLWSTKPPLLVWIQALLMKATGFNLLAVRLPSAVAGLATILALFTFLWRQTRSLLPPLAASLVLLTTPAFVANHGTRTGDYDALLTLWSTLFLIQLFCYLRESAAGKQRKHLWLALAFFTLGALTKGIAIFLFLPGLFLFLLASRQLLPLLRQSHFYLATLASVATIAAYYLAREWAGPGYLATVVQNDLGGRFLDVLEGHHGAWYYYFEKLAAGEFWPWIGFVPLAVWYSFRDPQPGRRIQWSYFLWNALGFLLILSIAQTKLNWYAIPVFPLLSLAVGGVLGILIERVGDPFNRPGWVKGLLLFGLFLVPFIRQIQQSYQVRDRLYGWEQRQYAGYMDMVRDWPSYTVVETDYNAHLAFYVKAYRASGQDLHRKYPYELSPGDTILLCEDHARNAVLERWPIEPLHNQKNCGLYLVGKK